MVAPIHISLDSGRVDVPGLPGEGASDEEKNERTLAVVADVAKELTRLQVAVEKDPREALKRVWTCHTYLEAFPVRWIRNYARRKEHNDATAAVASLRERLKGLLPEGQYQAAWDDLEFLRRGLPLLWNKFKVRGEVLRLILTPLGKLTHYQIRYQREDAEDLGRVCRDITDVIRTTAELDQEVQRWGPRNYPALLQENAPPVSIPPGVAAPAGGAMSLAGVGLLLLGGGGAALAGVVPGGVGAGAGMAGVGVVLGGLGLSQALKASGQRALAPGKFLELAARFRERLYLICALRVIDRLASRYARASDAFENLVKEQGGQARWKRIKLEGRDLGRLFAEDGDKWHEKETIEHWLAERVKTHFRLDSATLTAPGELDAQSWEVILRAYLLESSEREGRTEAELLDTVAELVFSRRGEDTRAERERAFARVYEAWDAQHASEG